MVLKSINPTDGTELAAFEELTPDAIEKALCSAEIASMGWKRSTFEERRAVLHMIAGILDRDQKALANLMTLEMGKPINQAVAEVQKCALACRYFADAGEALLSDDIVASPPAARIRYLPLGTILAIMPWNFPLWQVFRCLAPAIMAGNTMLLKHASNVPQCARAIEAVTQQAGLQPGVFQNLAIGSARIANIIRDKRIAAVTLTGSEAAGAAVARTAGGALKKCVLELGGNDPFIVLPSADLEKAIATGVAARITNNGQSCVCAKRFIVHRDVYDKFEAGFVAAMEALTVGDPMQGSTELGPLATAQGLETLRLQIEQSKSAGARLLTGGRPSGGDGYFYSATVLSDIPRDAASNDVEMFGPAAALFRADSFEHAMKLANDTPYGLGSSVWTNDPVEQQRCADEIESGQTFINAMVASDPRLPFGGIKLSGYGRELGVHGAREFTNIKTIVTAAGS
ncbi:NAD-dependent succinate-semialdehyde dehydrogenase [Nitratireductor sp. XY-223]|uniref:NAD-dependent succinate-semialdehyde dehydrogenase n=1 Tax=Nitratireductor sp. XY-223 TaxID=2561926 RepID=UPI0010AAD394|nr:NAD-dependent succinate-semialdehyde dehydrogenase [Nitratireductor sp. XY-223]